RLLSLTKLDGAVEQLVILPGAVVEKADWEALGSWVDAGGTLLVAGAARELPDWIGGALSPRHGLAEGPVTVAQDPAARVAPGKATVPPGVELQLGAATANASNQEEPQAHPLLMRGSAPYAIEQIYDRGRVILMADDSLFTNASLLVGGNAQLLGDLLLEGG